MGETVVMATIQLTIVRSIVHLMIPITPEQAREYIERWKLIGKAEAQSSRSLPQRLAPQTVSARDTG